MRIYSTRFIHLVFVLCLSAVWNFQSSAVQAQQRTDPADVYLSGYLLVQEAETLLEQKDRERAYRKFAEASKHFSALALRFPDFEREMVDFRRKKINEAIAGIENSRGGAGIVKGYTSRNGSRNSVGSGSRSMGRPPVGGGADSNLMKQLLQQKDEQIRALELERTQQGRELLKKDAELRRALGDRDTAKRKSDSLLKQFAQAQEELTKAHNAGGGDAAALKDEVARLQSEVALAKKSATDSAKRAENLQQELNKTSNYEASRLADRKELEEERDQLKKLLASTGNDQIKLLVKENDRLRSRLEEARKEVVSLREKDSDNEQLIAKLRSKITTVEAELANLQKENADYRQQVAQLTKQLKDTDARLDEMAKSKGGANPVLVKENQVLRSIIGKQLKSQARRKQAKQMVVAELAKLEIGSKEVLDMIDRMGDDAPLSQEEIETFQRSSGFDRALIGRGSGDGKMPEYPEVNNNDGPHTKIGLNEDLTQFAKAAAYDFFQGNFNRCEKSYETILEIVPDNIHSLRNLGIVKIRLKKWDEAKQVLEKALAWDPSDHYSHYVLGVLHYRLKESDAAIAAMEESLRVNPKNARAHFYIAVICMEMDAGSRVRRNHDRAIAELKQVLKLDPKHGDAHFNLAILYIESPEPRITQARQHYTEAQRYGSTGTPEMDRLLGT